MGDERDRHPRADEPDVEAHAAKKQSEEAAKPEGDDKDDGPDVEAHRHAL